MIKNKTFKKKINAVASIFLGALTLITSVLAFLTASDSKVNVFTSGNVDIELWEDFDGVKYDDGVSESFTTSQKLIGDTIEKAPYVKNVGLSDAQVYIAVGVPKDNVVTLTNYSSQLTEKQVQEVISIDSISANWADLGVYAKDDYFNYHLYKYSTVLAAGSETDAVFSSLTYKNISDMAFYPSENYETFTSGVSAVSFNDSYYGNTKSRYTTYNNDSFSFLVSKNTDATPLSNEALDELFAKVLAGTEEGTDVAIDNSGRQLLLVYNPRINNATETSNEITENKYERMYIDLKGEYEGRYFLNVKNNGLTLQRMPGDKSDGRFQLINETGTVLLELINHQHVTYGIGGELIDANMYVVYKNEKGVMYNQARNIERVGFDYSVKSFGYRIPVKAFAVQSDIDLSLSDLGLFDRMFGIYFNKYSTISTANIDNGQTIEAESALIAFDVDNLKITDANKIKMNGYLNNAECFYKISDNPISKDAMETIEICKYSDAGLQNDVYTIQEVLELSQYNGYSSRIVNFSSKTLGFTDVGGTSYEGKGYTTNSPFCELQFYNEANADSTITTGYAEKNVVPIARCVYTQFTDCFGITWEPGTYVYTSPKYNTESDPPAYEADVWTIQYNVGGGK